jgi:HPt (histidine-containing phosphotransfer) domain-containing protein
MDDYVSKPFDMNDFLGTIERWLSGGGGGVEPHEPGVIEEVFPVMDATHLDAVGKKMKAGPFTNILRAYLDGEGKWLRKIEEFGRIPDLAGLECEAHELKGVVGNLGARRLQKLAEDLEMASAAGDVPKALALVERLPALADEIRALVRARLTAVEAMAESEPMVP